MNQPLQYDSRLSAAKHQSIRKTPRSEGTLHRRLQPLYTAKHKVSCSGFLPNTSPMQRSCSHHNAFCSMTWLTRMYLRTWQHQMTTIMQPFQCDLQPQVQETYRTTHTKTTTRCRTQRIFCENKESHQRGSHQLGNKLKQIINHFETLDFIRLNFNDNHVSYLFLGQT